MAQLLFAPIEVSKSLSRRLHNHVTGNAYVLDARGTVLAQDVDVAWFQTQGFTLTAGTSAMYGPIGVAKAASRPVTSPVTGTIYYLDGRGGAVVAAAADVAWLRTQGYLALGQ
jgi:hypothetical protein